MNNKTLILSTVVFLVAACGFSDKKEDEQVQIQTTLTCQQRPALMRTSDRYSFSWLVENSSDTNHIEVDPGSTESYLDWGTFETSSNNSGTFFAPDFVPSSRKVDLRVVTDSDGQTIGSCPVYLITANNYGVADDGRTKGLVASVYPVPVGTLSSFFPSVSGSPVERSVAYAFDMIDLQGLPGITVSSQYVAIVFEGTIEVPATADYRFRLRANNLANLFIDGRQMITVANNLTSDSANLANGLAAGKHSIKIEYLRTSANYITLYLEWATRATATTYNPYNVIPYSAFDR